MKYEVDLSFPWESGYYWSNMVFDSLDSALEHMKTNDKFNPSMKELREVLDYREQFWSDQFGYSIAGKHSSKAYGSSSIMEGEKIQTKLRLDELLVIATDKAVYLFDPNKQVWYD